MASRMFARGGQRLPSCGFCRTICKHLLHLSAQGRKVGLVQTHCGSLEKRSACLA